MAKLAALGAHGREARGRRQQMAHEERVQRDSSRAAASERGKFARRDLGEQHVELVVREPAPPRAEPREDDVDLRFGARRVNDPRIAEQARDLGARDRGRRADVEPFTVRAVVREELGELVIQVFEARQRVEVGRQRQRRDDAARRVRACLLYTSPSPRD